MFRTSSVHHQERFVQAVFADFGMSFFGEFDTGRHNWTVPLAARSQAWVCSRSFAGIAGSVPAGGIYVCLLRMLCVVRYWSVRRTDPSSRGVLSSVYVALCVAGCNSNTLYPQGAGRSGPTKKEIQLEFIKLIALIHKETKIKREHKIIVI